MANDSPRSIRRDRHDRGLRGPLLPHTAPFHESPTAAFARELKYAVQDLDRRLGKRMHGLTIAFEEIPNLADLILSQNVVPLGRIDRGNPTAIVLYQRPIEIRCRTANLLPRIIRDVLAEFVAVCLGLEPLDVDPDYLGPEIRN